MDKLESIIDLLRELIRDEVRRQILQYPLQNEDTEAPPSEKDISENILEKYRFKKKSWNSRKKNA